jgi:hypothetical protein
VENSVENIPALYGQDQHKDITHRRKSDLGIFNHPTRAGRAALVQEMLDLYGANLA